MSIEYKKTVAIMEGECTVEDAEVLEDIKAFV